MSFNPFLVLLLLVLMGLLALSVGYRREQSAVRPLRRTIADLRTLAQRNPDRFGPSLALHMRLLAVELLESGRPMQALLAVMNSVDLYRVLAVRYPGRYDAELADSMDIEDALKVAVGFDPAMDLHTLAEIEELERHEDAEDTARAMRRKRRAFALQVALFMWVMSVAAFAVTAL